LIKASGPSLQPFDENGPAETEFLDILSRIDQDTSLDARAKHIEQQLNKRKFCVVFENDLKRCWPSRAMSPAKLNREIRHFAESHGWTAAILEGSFGTRAIIERMQPRVVDDEASLVELGERPADRFQ
jgi:hypothetical protein